jgi:hypothetical protein
MPLAARSEGGHLLVPDMHPVDLTLPTKRVVSSFKLSPTIP